MNGNSFFSLNAICVCFFCLFQHEILFKKIEHFSSHDSVDILTTHHHHHNAGGDVKSKKYKQKNVSTRKANFNHMLLFLALSFTIKWNAYTWLHLSKKQTEKNLFILNTFICVALSPHPGLIIMWMINVYYKNNKNKNEANIQSNTLFISFFVSFCCFFLYSTEFF